MWFWFFISYLILVVYFAVVWVIFSELISSVFYDKVENNVVSNLAPPTPSEDQATLAYVDNQSYLRTDGPDAKQVKITTNGADLPPLNVTLPMGTVMATTFVNILEPVLLLSKQDDIRIYHPDNSVEYYSYKGEWERIKVGYGNVYEYATRTNSIILENL